MSIGKYRNLVIIYRSEKVSVYAEKTFDDKPCKSTLGRASREAESPSGRHGQSTASKGFLSSKGNWNKLSERKCSNTLHIFGIVVYLTHTYKESLQEETK